MQVGNWEIKVLTDKLPQKVATAIGKLNEVLIGAEYEAIAYIGSQVANGTNHAVLAEQTVTTGRDTTNVVMLIFNEKPGENEATLVNIERVVEGGQALGGTVVDVRTAINSEDMEMWNEAFEGFVGSKVVPFAYLGLQTTKGTSYIYAATVEPVVPDPSAHVAVVTINPMTKEVSFADMLSSKQASSLKYAFTW